MFQVKIFLETELQGPGKRPGAYAAIVEYIKRNGDPETRKILGSLKSTTFYKSTIIAAIKALELLNQSCDVTIYTHCEYFKNIIDRNLLPTWSKNNWKKTNGSNVRNAAEWEKFFQLQKQHKIKIEYVDHHEYKNYMRDLFNDEVKKWV